MIRKKDVSYVSEFFNVKVDFYLKWFFGIWRFEDKYWIENKEVLLKLLYFFYLLVELGKFCI